MGDGLGERLDNVLIIQRSFKLRRRERIARSRRSLKTLARLLKQPKANLSEAGFYSSRDPELLADEDIERAEVLCRAVMVRRGPGSQLTLEGLFAALAAAGAPRSLPFWEEALAWNQKRDSMKRARCEFAVAGIALAALRAEDSAAKEALLALATAGPTPETQALAARTLWSVPLSLDQDIPLDVRQALARVAVADTGLLPRYQARLGLLALDMPLPTDAPEGSLSFTVRLGKGFHCVVELPSTATMADLHAGIQQGFGWDNDHLYSFFLDTTIWNRTFEVPGRDPFGDRIDPEGRSDAGDWKLGEVGFVTGVRFVYLFDYGDSHRFEITVSAINETAGPGPWPRLSRVGKPPPQYEDW